MITTDGVPLHVVEQGTGPVTLILLHGWTMDHTSWDDALALLPGVRVLRLDWRGHGRSGAAPAGTTTIDRLADDLAEVIAEHVPTGPIVLGGHSLGGMTMMALAERHPDLVRSRVAGAAFVATTHGGLSKLTLGLPRWAAAPVLYAERWVNRGLARLSSPALLRRSLVLRPGVRWLVFGKSPRWAHVALTSAQVGRCNPANMVGFRNALNEHERLHALGVYRGARTVVLAGELDRLCPLRDAHVLAGELPDAELVVFPGAGHMLNYERTAEVAARLSALVDAVGLRQKATA